MKEDSPELKKVKDLIMKLTTEEKLFLIEKLCQINNKENNNDSI